MAERVEIIKTVVNNRNFKKVVDTSFTYFATPEPVQDSDTAEELFRLYDKLYLTLPVTGTNSHETLVLRSSEFFQPPQTNDEIQPLLDEISNLRLQLLEANQEIVKLSSQIG
jgi:hypothetical protein